MLLSISIAGRGSVCVALKAKSTPYIGSGHCTIPVPYDCFDLEVVNVAVIRGEVARLGRSQCSVTSASQTAIYGSAVTGRKGRVTGGKNRCTRELACVAKFADIVSVVDAHRGRAP